MKKTPITKGQFLELLKAEKSARFFSMRTVTNAQKSKAKGAKPILKESVIGGIVNFIYANSVANQAKREGVADSYEAQPRKWGKHVTHSIIEHNGKFYVQVLPKRTLRNSRFFVDGLEVSKESIADQLAKSAPPSTQNHLERKVIPRDYAFDSIKEFKLNGKHYELV